MDENKLKLYVNRSRMSKIVDHSPLLYPFWGVISREQTPFTSALFKRHNFDPNYYVLTENIKEADFVFLPHNYWVLKRHDPGIIKAFMEPHGQARGTSSFRSSLMACPLGRNPAPEDPIHPRASPWSSGAWIKEAQENQKPILIDAYGDSMELVKIPQSIVLRLAQYRSCLQKNEIIIPTYTEDLLESYCGGVLSLREKSKTSSIGFAGWSKLPFLKYPRTRLKDLPLRAAGFFNPQYEIFRKGVFLREKAIEALNRSPLVKTNFLVRNFYSGHISTAEVSPELLRRQFVDNILESDYTLCVRGDANASTRFYEVLSLGRIPVFINTDCVLPLEDLVNYKEFCVWVEYKDMAKLPEILSEFHARLTDEDFQEMQKKARAVFEKYLCIDSFTKYLMQRLKFMARGH